MFTKEWYADPADLMRGWVTLTEHTQWSPTRGWEITGYTVHATHWSLPEGEPGFLPHSTGQPIAEWADALAAYVDRLSELDAANRQKPAPLPPQVQTLTGLADIRWVRLSELKDGDHIKDSHGWQVIQDVEHADGRTRWSLVGDDHRAVWPSSQAIQRTT